MTIHFYDRKTGELKQEIVFGDKFLKWVYDTKSGSFLLETLVKKKLFSTVYGKLQDTQYSAKKIQRFIEDLQIDMSEASLSDITLYKNFNEFFARELKAEARPIAADPHVLVSPADGKVYAWENIDPDRLLQVKGLEYSLMDLVGDKVLAKEYAQGSCIVVRLCPADYHRFHFPDNGVPSESTRIEGHYYSVNPRALKRIPRIYCENKRELTRFQSENFGEILLIEVGATCVGSIIQTYAPEKYVHKGAEKGYFKFGGSTTIMLLKKNTVRLDSDLIENTAKDIETKVSMGEQLGIKDL